MRDKAMLKRFDAWAQQGPFTSLDLGIYRILYSFCTLCILGDITWVAELPDSLYSPPLGVFQLLAGFPSSTLLIALEIARAVALVLLGLGLWTRTMSFAVAILLAASFGMTYSVGKIGHTILLVMTPLVLSFADWGHRLSIDSMRNPSSSKGSKQTQWPLRLLALIVGLAFLAAAGAKLVTGWLEFSTQATQGFFLRDYYIGGQSATLTQVGLGISNRLAWESLDWLTVIIEFAILASVPWWKAFRITLALATCFHLGVLLVFGIGFPNVIAYGAFVAWGAAATFIRIPRNRVQPVLFLVYAVIILAGFASIWIVVVQHAEIPYFFRVWTIYAGAAFGVTYLLTVVASWARAPKRAAGHG
ncbi:HTTM domain-containing protein [Mycolicibacterium austroafricanum]|uniref:HTTM domain-containing protein n=1 Tax=Mycolicibacterium austroafricanum TaxID=39687 RepID=UPI001CA307AB|nr:HTTM domain-containing protein [Mycolicibacterium austroafricanum]QZT58429.1 HTTM domain-containing protein [Mycolicibacterium austroafricanum]